MADDWRLCTSKLSSFFYRFPRLQQSDTSSLKLQKSAHFQHLDQRVSKGNWKTCFHIRWDLVSMIDDAHNRLVMTAKASNAHADWHNTWQGVQRPVFIHSAVSYPAVDFQNTHTHTRIFKFLSVGVGWISWRSEEEAAASDSAECGPGNSLAFACDLS